MGPFEKGLKCDIVWVEVDKMYYIVQRQPDRPLEEHFKNLLGIATGAASTMAGCNATGFKDLEDIIEEYTNKQITHYSEFIKNLNKK